MMTGRERTEAETGGRGLRVPPMAEFLAGLGVLEALAPGAGFGFRVTGRDGSAQVFARPSCRRAAALSAGCGRVVAELSDGASGRRLQLLVGAPDGPLSAVQRGEMALVALELLACLDRDAEACLGALARLGECGVFADA